MAGWVWPSASDACHSPAPVVASKALNPPIWCELNGGVNQVALYASKTTPFATAGCAPPATLDVDQSGLHCCVPKSLLQWSTPAASNAFKVPTGSGYGSLTTA